MLHNGPIKVMRDYIVEEENGTYKILFDTGWKDITKYDLERYYKQKDNK